jgi:SAM-dependent methyltransferase
MTDPHEQSLPGASSKFDAYAANYEALHQENVRSSGEDPAYFARYKLDCLRRVGVDDPVLDYGCGIGSLTTLLASEFAEVHGCDPSGESLRVARRRVPGARFWDGQAPLAHFGTAVLAGVLHHIPPAERARALSDVFATLRPGGRVVIFEHNPYNPLTRKAVRECPFDDDAILLTASELRGRLRLSGFVDVSTNYIVFFPRLLRALRALEPRLSWCALGAQTMTVGRRAG